MAKQPKQDVTRRDFIRDAAKVAGVTVGTAATVKQATGQPFKQYKSILPHTIMGANEQSDVVEQASHCQAEDDRDGNKDVLVLGHL